MLENEFDPKLALSTKAFDAVDKQQGFLIIDNIVGNRALSDLQNPESVADIFCTDIQTLSNKNSRAATRLIRDDIAVRINTSCLLGFGKTISVDLMDISSKGVLISTHQKLRINKKITLTLLFESGKTFVIKAIVVRHSGSARNEYGIKFGRYNNELGDYLFESQEKLIFK